MRTNRWRIALLCIALGLIVVTAGCGAGGGGGSGAGTAQPPDAASDGSKKASTSDDGRVSSSGSVEIGERAIRRTGNATLEVENFERARRNLSSSVSRLGGFVSDSRLEVRTIANETYRTGMIVLRVPRENFSAMMDRVRNTGTVLSANTSSTDVTDRLVDLEARLKTLRIERKRLRDLYRDTTDTEEALSVEKRLSEVQLEIERLKAKRRALKRNVALSTIRVRMREPRPEPNRSTNADESRKWYDTPILVALGDSIQGVITTIRIVAVALAYVLPYLLVFGVPLVGVAYVAGDRLNRRSVSEMQSRRRRERDGRKQSEASKERQEQSDAEQRHDIDRDSSTQERSDRETDERGPRDRGSDGSKDDGSNHW